jgi:predicted RNA-binding protein associated with RNAse of E/G family
MNKPRILRKRFIPDETVDISKDELLFRSDELLVTRWNTIKPRTDISKGVSYTFLKEGYKISRFYNPAGDFVYWYVDIIDVLYDIESDTYTLADLLVDVKLMPDGTLMVLDADELAEAMETGMITGKMACESLRKLDKVLKMIYEGKFPPLICNEESF